MVWWLVSKFILRFMLKTTTSFADPIESMSPSDILSQMLSFMRITGSLLVREQYCAPWAVMVPHSDVLNTLLSADKKARIAAFHMVERGHIRVQLDNGNDTSVNAGEMVVCFSGSGHRLFEGDSSQVLTFQEIMAGAENSFLRDTEEEPCTSLICGVFILHDTLLNPFFATLPEILKLSVSDPDNFPRLYGVVNLLEQDIKHRTVGRKFVIERYLEILCAEAIRSYADNNSEQTTGWLSALKDPVIGRAIEVIHRRPGYNWSVKDLAREVSMSPSRFATRFTTTLGESPMVYVAKWRMFIASKMLETSQLSIEQIANNMGYESLAAFSRAFKRHVGLPPATWRTQARCST